MAARVRVLGVREIFEREMHGVKERWREKRNRKRETLGDREEREDRQHDRWMIKRERQRIEGREKGETGERRFLFLRGRF